jgi:hypothetical protein
MQVVGALQHFQHLRVEAAERVSEPALTTRIIAGIEPSMTCINP